MMIKYMLVILDTGNLVWKKINDTLNILIYCMKILNGFKDTKYLSIHIKYKLNTLLDLNDEIN